MEGKEIVKQTLDQIPQVNFKAKQISGLVKEDGRITGHQLFSIFCSVWFCNTV